MNYNELNINLSVKKAPLIFKQVHKDDIICSAGTYLKYWV